MVSKKFVIENEQGLHMRPAGVLAKAVTKFESDVTIVFEDKKINAKSLLNIIGACIKCGSEIELVCEGPDEEDDVEFYERNQKKYPEAYVCSQKIVEHIEQHYNCKLSADEKMYLIIYVKRLILEMGHQS